MVDGTLRWILRHEKRAWIVITLTFLTGLLLVLPAVEEYSAATDRLEAATAKLSEANHQVQNLPLLRRLADQRKREVELLEAKSIKEVAQFRDTLQRLIRETGCEFRELIVPPEPNRKAWRSNDSPTLGATTAEPGQETNYQLVSWQARLRLEGPMPNVYQFLARMHQLDRFIHAKEIVLQRSDVDENATTLEMKFEMFDLARKQAG